MDNLIFNNDEFGSVRAVEINGEPWFVGKDVAEALGYSNVRDAISKHVDDEDKGVAKCDTLGGSQNLSVINESGLYSLVLSSHLENAKRFKRWITSEVIPSIRKHGAYATPATIEKLINNPDFGIKLLEALKSEQEKNKQLTAENEEMKPKAAFADKVSASETSIHVRDLAKLIAQNGISIGQNRMFAWLRDNKYLMYNNMPYQEYIERGYFVVKERPLDMPDGKIKLVGTVKVTGKGQVYFVNKFLKEKVGI